MSLIRTLDRLFKHEAAGGIALMASAALAFIIANSALSGGYHGTLNLPFTVMLGEGGLQKPLILWINDGMMAIFFFLIGLELKREMMEGKLKNPSDVILPGMAAVGGMAAPALIFLLFNYNNPLTVHGWAIPAATDIAFAVGVLAMVGSRIPASLKIFLLTLAILDDLGAIVIIALFYTAELKVDYLWLSLIPLAGLYLLNRSGSPRIAPIVIVGMVLWFFVLKSGVHATLAGVITALFVPLKDRTGTSPLHAVEHGLSPYVFFLIVPIFAFANAGVVLAGMTLEDLFSVLPLGIAAGLFVGKQMGVFGVAWLMVKLGLAKIPAGATWLQVYGVACLAGIGFTMSLFIGSLSYTDDLLMNEVRLGVLLGSAMSGIVGYLVLRYSPARAVPAHRMADDLKARKDQAESPVIPG